MEEPNVRTMAVELALLPRSACEALVARAMAAASALPAPREGVAFRVFWSRDGMGDATLERELAFADLHVDDHLVVGRHTSSDVHLSDPSAALRHLLLTVRRPIAAREGAAASGPALVVHDLATDHGFRVGLPQTFSRGVVAEGATILGVASELLVALPTTEQGPDDTSALRPLVVEADPVGVRTIPVELPALAVRSQMTAISRTQVRSLEPPLAVEIVPSRDEPWVRLSLRGPGGRVVVEVSEDDLASPVLVGRYPRCRRGELSPFSMNVSRVHAALVRDGDAIRVIDLASTNGLATRTGKGRREPARAIRVTSRASISLGSRDDRLEVQILRPARVAR
ncbi:MAG: FHA domain-containing protein [Sandaracinus sp.]